MAASLPPPGADDVLYLVDISGYIFRSHHAISTPLTSPSGEPTSTTLGTITMLQRMLNDQRPRLVAVAMDSSSQTFRREIDPNYKAHRPPPPEDLKQQIVRTREILEAYRLPILQRDGFEADDLIASAVRQARALKLRAVIVSADKDLMQLVGDDVLMWDTMRNRVFGPAEVEEKWRVAPSKLRDVLALMGDTSDNVPGVPHVGEKSAADLINTFGDIDALYARIDEVKQKRIRESLIANRTDAELSRRLVTLKDDLEVGLVADDFTPKEPDREKLRALFTELNFGRLLASVSDRAKAPAAGAPGPVAPGSAAASAQPPPGPRARTYVAVQDEAALVALCERAARAPLLAVDTETSSLQPNQARLVGVSLSIDPAEGYYVPLQHDWGLMAPDQIPLDVARKHLAPLLAADTPPKVGHHMKFDELVLRSHGMPVGPVAFDTMLASYLLDPEAEHGLKAMAQRELRETMKTYEEVVGKVGRGKLRPFAEVPLEDATPYAGADAAITLDLVDRMRSQVESAGMEKLLREVEIPLSRILADMEAHGVLVDIEHMRLIGRDLDALIVELEKKAKEAAGRDINVNSPKQLEELLFDELGLPIQRRTKTGRSTDAETLDALSEYHPLPGIILELRQMTKLKGTYIDALPLLVNPRTGRIHTSFNQTVAATGRLSSSDPNLQNIPIRTDEGRKIRSAFIAPKGHSIVAADYSQIELRLLAHFSKDPVLLDTFQRGEDIHTRTAVEMFGKPAGEITGAQRRAAKTINFGVVYGIGDSALAKRLDISKEEAARYIEVYFQRYAGVRAYFDRVLEEARMAGGVGTLLGRRRFLPALTSANRGVRLQAERIAQNTPIQGTAADILKLAMVGLREPVVPGATMVLTVHDELLFEVPHGHEQAAMDRAREVMEGVGTSLKLDVPLRVEAGFGRSWADAHG